MSTTSPDGWDHRRGANTVDDRRFVRLASNSAIIGVYEWTRVPMGLLPSAIFFQNSMGVHVLNGLVYNICELYIDDMLNDDTFIDNTRTEFQRRRERNERENVDHRVRHYTLRRT